MSTLVEQLSTYATGLCYAAQPPGVVHQAKRLIIDGVACALGGYASEASKIARESAGLVTSGRLATIMVSGEHTSADLATFANGVMTRYLDFKVGCTSTGESGHPSDSTAAVLSIAELMRRSGREHPFKIMERSIKRFLLGHYAQTVAEVVIKIRNRINDMSEISEVRTETVSAAVR